MPLPESQGHVAWTPQLVRTQQRSRMWSACFFVGAVLTFGAAIGFYFWQVSQNNDGQVSQKKGDV